MALNERKLNREGLTSVSAMIAVLDATSVFSCQTSSDCFSRLLIEIGFLSGCCDD